MTMETLLDVAELSKRYTLQPSGSPLARAIRRFRHGPEAIPKLHAVDDVSFTIGRGETVGLVGESGCGKSTLVRLIARLIDGNEGSIRLGSRELTHIPAKRFARVEERVKIQMVFQDAGESINPRYTAADAIADPLRRLRRLSGSQLTAKVEQAANRCGLPLELLSRYPHQLSGGQRARVGIARAIAVEPELLILDEPTAALDVSVQVVILQLLEKLKAELGMSYLFVSHDLNVVRLLCDRVLVMYLGKIVESGPARDVFAKPAHPYTRALVDAVPDANRPPSERIRLSGEIASPIDPDPDTCRFVGRCPRAEAVCKQAMPRLLPVTPGHQSACHFSTNGPQT
ncbi:MAG: oligopeptide/dipeptide ABC transporter ATP-binding protein [Rhabdaerophilum sp.]